MFTKPLVRGLAVALGAALAASLALASPASAQEIGPDQGGAVLTAPPAPDGPWPGPTEAIAAAAPTVSPSVSTYHVAPGATYYCASGYFCTAVWNPTNSLWKIFDFYHCDRYYLSSWLGNGNYYNNQTGNPLVRFYRQNGTVLKSFRSKGGAGQNWDPVWSIRPCG